MAHVAAEMEREGFDIPLLIGGATTSRVHTAVKIHPRYARGADRLRQRRQPRGRRRLARCCRPRRARRYVETVRAEYRKVAEAHARSEADKQRLPLAKARANALKIDWSAYRADAPSFLGAARIRDARPRRARALYRLDAVLPDLGAEGPLSRDPRRREAGRGGARAVRRRAGDAEAHHRRALVRAQGGDRLLAGGRGRRRHPALRRRERARAGSRPSSRCASSSPSATAGPMSRSPISSGRRDYVGGFVVTAGIEEEAIAKRFAHANDDYSSILVKALADRFAEAFAEAMHARVRREFWGYAPDETLRARGADRRALSRHPPGARLSRPARPHREGDAVPPARRRGARSA